MAMISYPATDLFTDIDTRINARLGVQDFKTRTSAKALATRDPGTPVGEALVEDMFVTLRENWRRALPSAKGSAENFRWHKPQFALGGRNTSPEVTLERVFIQRCCDAGRKDWSNQVPLISGIAGSHTYKRRAVDLVRQLPDGGFEFVELKVESNTPLHAAMEILLYGLLWLLSRESRAELGYGSRIVLDSPSLALSTLAPANFYTGGIPWNLIEGIDLGLAELGRRHGVVMGFRLTAFPEDFAWSGDDPSSEPVRWFDDRAVLTPCG